MRDYDWWEAKPLLRKMWKTRNARFEASRRLSRKKMIGVYLNSVLSLFIICVSLLATFSPEMFNGNALKAVSLFSILGSILIIILTFIQSSESLELKSEILHNCARDILEIYNEYDEDVEINKGKKDDFLKRYQDIINKCPYNHDDIDFEKANIDFDRNIKGMTFGIFFRKIIHFTKYSLNMISQTIITMVILIILFIVINGGKLPFL